MKARFKKLSSDHNKRQEFNQQFTEEERNYLRGARYQVRKDITLIKKFKEFMK